MITKSSIGNGKIELKEEIEQLVEVKTQALRQENDHLKKELIRKEEALKDLHKIKESLEMTNWIKSNLFNNMSHELRNPLNSILGFSQVLLEKYFGPLNTKQEQYIKDIHESGQDLLALINDILDLTRPDNENNDLHLGYVNIGELIRASLNFIRQKAFMHNIDINFSVQEDLNTLPMNLDKRKMKQILFNLFSHALSLTPDGGQMGVIAERFMVENRDSVGISIVAEYRSKTVEEPTRDKNGKMNQIPIPAPELNWTRSLVTLHGGTLLQNSQEGKESRFTIILPI